MTETMMKEYGNVSMYSMVPDSVWDTRDAVNYILKNAKETGSISIVNSYGKEGFSQIIYSKSGIVSGQVPSIVESAVISHISMIHSGSHKHWIITVF